MVDLDETGVGLLVEIEEFSLVLVFFFFLSRSWINKTRKTLVYVSVSPGVRAAVWLWYLCAGAGLI